jgi:hypothetical protein
MESHEVESQEAESQEAELQEVSGGSREPEEPRGMARPRLVCSSEASGYYRISS